MPYGRHPSIRSRFSPSGTRRQASSQRFSSFVFDARAAEVERFLTYLAVAIRRPRLLCGVAVYFAWFRPPSCTVADLADLDQCRRKGSKWRRLRCRLESANLADS